MSSVHLKDKPVQNSLQFKVMLLLSLTILTVSAAQSWYFLQQTEHVF